MRAFFSLCWPFLECAASFRQKQSSESDSKVVLLRLESPTTVDLSTALPKTNVEFELRTPLSNKFIVVDYCPPLEQIKNVSKLKCKFRISLQFIDITVWPTARPRNGNVRRCTDDNVDQTLLVNNKRTFEKCCAVWLMSPRALSPRALSRRKAPSFSLHTISL